MAKLLEALVERYAPENVRKQLAQVNELRKFERDARLERRQAERALLVATMPQFPERIARIADAA